MWLRRDGPQVGCTGLFACQDHLEPAFSRIARVFSEARVLLAFLAKAPFLFCSRH